MFFAFDAIKRRFVQLLNACSMMVTLSLLPSSTPESEVQFLNAETPMVLTVSGSETYSSVAQPSNACAAMPVDRFFLAVNDDLAVILADAVRHIDYDDLSVRFHVEAAVVRCARRPQTRPPQHPLRRAFY